jgi:hypothetical protein
LLCNKRIVFSSLSSVADNYNITFEISTNTFDPVQVSLSNIGLNNINPTIYRISPGGYYPSEATNGAKLVNQDNPLTLVQSDQDNPISIVVGTGQYYNMILNAQVTEKSDLPGTSYSNFPFARFSFVSNGFDPVTSFDASTDSANISPQTKRLEGLEYTIEEVTRYYGGFRSGSGGASGVYFAITTFGPTNKISDFSTTYDGIPIGQQPPFTSFSQALRYVGGTSFAGMPTNNEINSGYSGANYKGAWVYEIKLRITDASNGPASLPSTSYTIHYIIHR